MKLNTPVLKYSKLSAGKWMIEDEANKPHFFVETGKTKEEALINLISQLEIGSLKRFDLSDGQI